VMDWILGIFDLPMSDAIACRNAVHSIRIRNPTRFQSMI
jgi:hypothetical protein